jgi:foldase protein PrsA
MMNMKRAKRLLGPIVLLALAGLVVWTAARSGMFGKDGPDEASPSGTGTGTNSERTDVVGRVAGVDITREQLTEELLALYGNQTLRTLMLRIAAEREAKALGVVVTEAELARELRKMAEGYESEDEFYRVMQEQLGMDRQRVRQDAYDRLLLEKLAMLTVVVTDEEIQQYWAEHAEEFGPREELRISRIVLADPEEAERVLTRLERGEDFAALAKSLSLDPFSAEYGGDLGWVAEDDPFVPAAVREAARRLEVGSITGPVRTDDGAEVIMLTGRRTIPAPDPEEVRAEIRKRLALGKAPSMRDLEDALLAKYGAEVFLEN